MCQNLQGKVYCTLKLVLLIMQGINILIFLIKVRKFGKINLTVINQIYGH